MESTETLGRKRGVLAKRAAQADQIEKRINLNSAKAAEENPRIHGIGIFHPAGEWL